MQSTRNSNRFPSLLLIVGVAMAGVVPAVRVFSKEKRHVPQRVAPLAPGDESNDSEQLVVEPDNAPEPSTLIAPDSSAPDAGGNVIRARSAHSSEVLLDLARFWRAARGGSPCGGPVLIGGDDADDHGSVNAGVNQRGWLYIEEGFNLIGPAVGTGNQVAVCLGCNVGQASGGFESGFDLSNLPGAGWTRQTVTGNADIAAFFAGANGTANIADAGIVYMPSDSGNVGGGITSTETDAVNANAAAINSFVSNGGGLFTHSQQFIAGGFGWLQSLLPGLVPNGEDGCSSTQLNLTAAGALAFPNLTDAILSNATPWHTWFSGDLGGLQSLMTGPCNGNNEPVIIGGAIGGAIAGTSQVNFSQPPTSDGEDIPSNIDWTDNDPNVVVADDFISDGRPIHAVRWWGSLLVDTEPTGPTDNCNMKPVVNEGTFSFENSGTDTDGPPATCAGLASDVWLNYVPTCTGTATIHTCGSSFDTALEIFSGCTCNPPGTVLACNDDAENGPCLGSPQSLVSIPVTSGECVKVRIGGHSCEQGTGTVTITCDESVCGTGDCCTANGTPGCDDAACCSQVCSVDPFCCDTEWDGICADEAFALCAICGGASRISDACPATNVGVLSDGSTFSGTTIGSFNDFFANCASTGGLDEIFAFTVACSDTWTFDNCATIATCWDSALEIREETGGGCPGSFVTCSDDSGCGACGVWSEASAFLTAGTTYYLIVDGFSTSASGDFTITASSTGPCNPPVGGFELFGSQPVGGGGSGVSRVWQINVPGGPDNALPDQPAFALSGLANIGTGLLGVSGNSGGGTIYSIGFDGVITSSRAPGAGIASIAGASAAPPSAAAFGFTPGNVYATASLAGGGLTTDLVDLGSAGNGPDLPLGALTILGVEGLAFDPVTGVLFGSTGPGFFGFAHLVTITATGLVADLGEIMVDGLAFDGTVAGLAFQGGSLYGSLGAASFGAGAGNVILIPVANPSGATTDHSVTGGDSLAGLTHHGDGVVPQVPEPDGWFISFHEPLLAGLAPEPPLGLYFCDEADVQISTTTFSACDEHDVLEYEIDLQSCCLVHANDDSRTGLTPAQLNGFLEESCLIYGIDIQAVVGHKLVDDGFGNCIEETTGKSWPSDVWGWHSTSTEIGAEIGLGSALQTVVSMSGTEWLYGPWSPVDITCGQPNMAFELITNTPSEENPDSNGNGVPDVCESDFEPPVRAGPPHDILKNRYISIDPRGANGINPPNLQISVEVDSSEINGLNGLGPWWAGEPNANCISIVTTTKPAAEPDWSACPAAHLTGCPIVPTTTYSIVAESDGQSSVAVLLDTQARPGDQWHGDCVGIFNGTAWTAPNGVTSIDDAVAAIKTFQVPTALPGCGTPPCNATHLSVTDMEPNLTPGPQINKVVNIADVFSIIKGFQGTEYPGPDLTQCP